MIIYLARHGQTTGDVENRYGGAYEDHMTELGKQQAVKLAGLLADKQIEQLYASPRIRAQEAAAIVANKLGLTYKTLEDFRERNGYGVMTGMVKRPP
jgi:broad specificity phosphatase PhoE